MDTIIRQIARISLRSVQLLHVPATKGLTIKSSLHTSVAAFAGPTTSGPRKWPNYNSKVFPPQQPGEEKRPAVQILCLNIERLRIIKLCLLITVCLPYEEQHKIQPLEDVVCCFNDSGHVY